MNPFELADRYCRELPLDINSLRLFSGAWTTSVPGFEEVTGDFAGFDDVRIHWLLSKVNISSRPVLEFGPLEGGHTYMLEKLGKADVTSIEGNIYSFIRCLIVKNALNLRAKFILGDINSFLQYTTTNYDLITLSGVLYHQLMPENLLYEASLKTDKIFIWTHYYDPDRPAENIEKNPVNRIYRSFKISLHKHTYIDPQAIQFSGGFNKYSYWLERSSLIGLLEFLGYDVEVHSENMHPLYPDILLLATRK